MSEPYVDFDAIKAQVSVYRVLEHVGWKAVWRKADAAKGPCPVHRSHTERSRSLSVCGTGWYCWVCKEHGDVIRLWSLLRGLDAHAAALDLCALFHLVVPTRGFPRRRNGNGGEAR